MNNRPKSPGPGNNSFEDFDAVTSDVRFTQVMSDYMMAHKSVLSPLIQGVGTAGLVNFFCFPLETAQTWRQTGLPPAVKFGSPLLVNLKTLLKPMAETYISAQKQALVKTTVVGNSAHVHRTVDEALGLKEEPQVSSSKKKMNDAISIGLTTVLIGSADTLLTNYHANKRVMGAMMKETGPLNGAMNIMKFASLGIGARALRNFTNAGIITLTTVFQVQRRQNAEQNENSATGEKSNGNSLIIEAGSTVIAGGIAGMATNGLDLIYKEQMRNMDVVTKVTPKMMEAAKSIYQKGGAKGFMKGSLYSMLINIAAYAGIGLADYLVTEKLFSKKREDEFITRRKSMFDQPENTRAINSSITENAPAVSAQSSQAVEMPKTENISTDLQAAEKASYPKLENGVAKKPGMFEQSVPNPIVLNETSRNADVKTESSDETPRVKM